VGFCLLAAALVVGCENNAPRNAQRAPAALHPDDQLMQDWFAVANRVLDLGAVPGEAARRERERLDALGQKYGETFRSWPKEKQDALNAKYQLEKDALNQRLMKALLR
jgi:hypothetical protein